MIKMNAVCFFFFVAVAVVNCADTDPTRVVIVDVNPGCNITECNEGNATTKSVSNLVWLKAVGSNDTINVLYSNIGAFSIMMFRTKGLDPKLTVNWAKLVNQSGNIFDSIAFSDEIVDTNGYIFPVIYEFNDVGGNADMGKVVAENSSYWVWHNTGDLVWKKFNTDDTKNRGVFEGSTPNALGSFKFALRFPGKTIRDDDLPHMSLNSDSGSVDFIIDSLNSNFKLSKFAISVLFVSTTAIGTLSSDKTIDDEYTPGTFKIFNVVLKKQGSDAAQSFFQWKPIFYYYSVRTLENSTITKDYALTNANPAPFSIASAFIDPSKLNFQGTNVSFGLQGDEKDGYFYNTTQYSVWTFSYGFGAAPVESMSFVVTLVIFIGFGLPALVIVIGLVVMIVKKMKKPKTNYNSL